MNGRVYDPELGRFLSPDPFVQFPDSPQGYNRYAYVANNPLSYNDPSGHFLGALMIAYSTINGYRHGGLGGAVKGFVLSFGSSLVAGGIGTHYQNVAMTNAYNTAMSGGGYVQPFLNPTQMLAKAALHGITQGAISRAGGGRFGDGALGAAASSLADPIVGRMDRGPSQAFAAAVIGGTVSVIGGGIFANGAITAAFVNVFNCQGHCERVEGEAEDKLHIEYGDEYQEIVPVRGFSSRRAVVGFDALPEPQGNVEGDVAMELASETVKLLSRGRISPVSIPMETYGAETTADFALYRERTVRDVYYYRGKELQGVSKDHVSDGNFYEREVPGARYKWSPRNVPGAFGVPDSMSLLNTPTDRWRDVTGGSPVFKLQ